MPMCRAENRTERRSWRRSKRPPSGSRARTRRWPTRGRSRLASLSVRTHVALFTPEQLHASWAAWWATLSDCAEWVSGASNLTLISGPSRTADIEMTLTVGVHGPREVIALYAD